MSDSSRSTPKRIQRKRTKGWRMPEGAVYVGRPTKWGNRYVLEWWSSFREWAVVRDERVLFVWTAADPHNDAKAMCQRKSVELFSDDLVQSVRDLARLELFGHDLACWCPLDQPCHADILLQVANP